MLVATAATSTSEAVANFANTLRPARGSQVDLEHGQRQQIAGEIENDVGRAVISCWTKKEACLKASGVGLAIPLNAFTMPLITDPARGPVDLHVPSSESIQAYPWSVFTIRPAPGYIGALAIEGRGWRLSHRQWNGPGSEPAANYFAATSAALSLLNETESRAL